MDANTAGGAGSASSSFTCNVCQAKFEDNVQQRAHTKGDWHIYNLKRRIASLPAISKDVYNDQILNIQEASTTAEAVASSAFQKSCTVCEKTFLNHTAYQNHFKSRNHAQEVARLEAKDELPATMERITLESEAPAEMEAEAGEFVPSVCLFCNFDSKSLDLNISHMKKKHGLFIADQEYLVDLETFIGYLYTVISQFHECLYCGSNKDSAQAIRSHMISKGHCNLKPDPGSEYEDFYEVASDIEDEDVDAGAKEAKGKSPDLVPDDNQLHLPSGRILGHRSQARYYRQHTPIGGRSTERRAIEDSKEAVDGGEQTEGSRNTNRQLTTRSRGEMGMVGVSDFQKRALMAVEKKMLKAELRAKSDYRAGLERLGNKQKYYRADGPSRPNG